MKLCLLRILLLPLAACLLAAADRPADPSGTWQWTTTNRSGQVAQFTAQLQVQGGSLTGTVSSPKGQWRIENATFTGSSIVFTVVFSGKATATYSGTLRGDMITGTIVVTTSKKGMITHDWNARRDTFAAPAPVS